MSAPFEQTTTPTIERANRLLSVRSNPGFLDIIRLSQDLVQSAADVCADFPGWDPQQIVVLKVRMQCAKEHHRLLLAKIQEAIEAGVAEQTALQNQFPEKTAEAVVEQGDYVRQEVLTRFSEMDNRSAGSYGPPEVPPIVSESL